MDMYKQAVLDKVRIKTNKGELPLEQVATLDKNELNDLAVGLEEEYLKSGKKSFLAVKSVKNKAIKLQLDLVVDLLNTKLEAEEIATQAREDKEHNNKIIALIAEKKDESLKGLSIKELEKQLR